MMSISPLYTAGSAQGTARTRSPTPVGGAGCFVVADPPPPAAASVARTRGIAVLNPLLLGRQDDERETNNDRGRRRARALLAGLARLQLRLLAADPADDEGGRELLSDLRAQLRNLPAHLDPELARVVAAIALRVEVELARHGAG